MTGNDDIDRTEHSRHMRRALDLALGGRGRTSPNPLTGCVVVKDGRVIGEGFHRRHGAAHAEAAALDACREDPRGAHLYCNLEPCARVYPGKLTPPCAERIIRAGIGRASIATLDPAPQVSGAGVQQLRAAGIAVTIGEQAEAALRLNLPFFTAVHYRRPFVHLKAAQSLDGRIATASGNSQWITDQAARAVVHQMRAEHDAVLVGRVTALRDNPRLTVRTPTTAGPEAPTPWRVVLDERLELPPSAHLVSDQHAARTLILTADRAGAAAVPGAGGGRGEPGTGDYRRAHDHAGAAARSAAEPGERVTGNRSSGEQSSVDPNSADRAAHDRGSSECAACDRAAGAAGARAVAVGAVAVRAAAVRAVAVRAVAVRAAAVRAATGDQTAVSGAAADQLQRRRAALEAHGAQVVTVAADAAGRLDLAAVLAVLYDRGIRSLLVEGGSEVHTSLLKAGLFDQVTLFVAPLLIGRGVEFVGDLETGLVADAIRLQGVTTGTINDQVMISGYRDLDRIRRIVTPDQATMAPGAERATARAG